jgi:hypothetical protein
MPKIDFGAWGHGMVLLVYSMLPLMDSGYCLPFSLFIVSYQVQAVAPI